MRTLVIGWGNPLRGDDGLGWTAAAALEERDVQVRVSHQLMPEYAEEISRSDLVVFIDAACDNGSGELQAGKIEPRCSPSAGFSHQLDPAGLLGLAEGLYGSCPEAYLFSVGGRRFDYGEELSEEVQSAVPELLARVRQVIHTYSTRNHER
jgi:hydrogenase maturation protease